jgi:magnesium-transporting ATPase (P-type)
LLEGCGCGNLSGHCNFRGQNAADVILLEKDLNVLAAGVHRGRITDGNTIKYIKMAASSNFGNVFSILHCLYFPCK